MRPLAIALVFLLGLPSLGGAQSVDFLIQNLGHPTFSVRQKAHHELRRRGWEAHAPLLRAIASDNAEIARRARQLVGELRTEDDQLLHLFLNGNRAGIPPLPAAWERFRRQFGDSPASRQFFVDLAGAEKELLLIDPTTPRAKNLFAQRWQKFLQNMGQFDPENPASRTMQDFIGPLYLMVSKNLASPSPENNQFSPLIWQNLPGMLFLQTHGPSRRFFTQFLLQEPVPEPELEAYIELAACLDLKEVLDRFRPRGRALVEKALGEKDPLRLMTVFYLAELLDLHDLIENRLRPEGRKHVRWLLKQNGTDSLDTAFGLVQTLNLQTEFRDDFRRTLEKSLSQPGGRKEAVMNLSLFDVIAEELGIEGFREFTLRPQVRRLLLEQAQLPFQVEEWQQLAGACQVLEMDDLYHSILSPAALVLIGDRLSEAKSFTEINILLQQSQILNLQTALAPAVEAWGREQAKTKDLTELTQILAQGANLDPEYFSALKKGMGPGVKEKISVLLKHPLPPPQLDPLLEIIRMVEFREAVPLLLPIARDAKQHPHFRGRVTLLVGFLGSPADIPQLESLLATPVVIGSYQDGLNKKTCDLRDVALASLILISQGNPSQFNFDAMEDLRELGYPFLPTSCAFPDEKTRQDSIRLWKASRRNDRR